MSQSFIAAGISFQTSVPLKVVYLCRTAQSPLVEGLVVSPRVLDPNIINSPKGGGGARPCRTKLIQT